MKWFERIAHRIRDGDRAQIEAHLRALADEADRQVPWANLDEMTSSDAWVAAAAAAPTVRAELTVLTIEAGLGVHGERSSQLRTMGLGMLADPPPLTGEQLIRLSAAFRQADYYDSSGREMVGVVERALAQAPLDEPVLAELRALRAHWGAKGTKAVRQLGDRLAALLDPPAGYSFGDGAWAQQIAAWVTTQTDVEAWVALLEHCRKGTSATRPSARWIQRARPLVDALPGFRARVEAWMGSAPLTTQGEDWQQTPTLNNEEQNVLRGLVWASQHVNDAALPNLLREFGERAYRKIPDFGAACPRAGSAAVHALGALPDGVGVPHLMRLGDRVKYRNANRAIEHAIGAASEASGLTPEELVETTVPTFGLVDGIATTQVGDHQVELRLAGSGVTLAWLKPNGRRLKSAPKALREQSPDRVKTFEAQAKSLSVLVASQVARLEGQWVSGRRVSWSALRDRYLQHPVVGHVARRLLWTVGDEVGLWQAGGLTTLGGAVIEADDHTECRLWHPIEADTDTIQVWSDVLAARGIVQPFKQVWREIYRDAANPDDRFAGRYLHQQALISQCRKLGWTYALQGHWDSANWPVIDLPHEGLRVEFAVDPVAHSTDDVFFHYLVSGRVRWSRPSGGEIDVTRIRPVLASEVLLAVDRIVVACSVGRDPQFHEGRVGRAWADGVVAEAIWGPLGAVAQTRRRALAQVLPHAPFAGSLTATTLVVAGFEIHLGSGHVRDGSGATIVHRPADGARAAADQVALPFEGDRLLREILATAFGLAHS